MCVCVCVCVCACVRVCVCVLQTHELPRSGLNACVYVCVCVRACVYVSHSRAAEKWIKSLYVGVRGCVCRRLTNCRRRVLTKHGKRFHRNSFWPFCALFR